MTLSGLTHICSAGETFDSLALAVYGDERYAADLLNANPSLCGKQLFTGGEVVLLPVVEVVEDEDESYMPATAPWKE